ncbi:unnamed protein product [Brachionus calyciflorus]|uniref:Uncharacterized protein n=1 Tax=Brachionus calyciflorus TaxID=104777 RepID=A0A813XW88_9BILA|nr:unnamed protein product [Brachionus calyciflorus]
MFLVNSTRLSNLKSLDRSKYFVIRLHTSSQLNEGSFKSKKYNKPPPIDLKKVRTNSGENPKEAFPKPSRLAAIVLLAVPAITFSCS